MSKKGKKLSPEQEAALKHIADVIGKYVTSGTLSNLPVDKNTGKIRPKDSSGSANNQDKVALLPEELYEIFKEVFQDDTLPPEWLARLKKLKQDVDRNMYNLNVEEKRKIRERMRSTKRGKSADISGFTDEMKAAMEAERKLRQEFGTEILNSIEQAMEEQESQDGEDGEENSEEAEEFEEGLDSDEDGDEEGEGDAEGASEGTEGDEGDEAAAQAFADSLEEGDESDEEGKIPGMGEEASQDGDSAFNLGQGKVDESEVAQFIAALEMIMARQADNPNRLPKWNKRELAKRNSTFRNPMPAKKPILQQQGVVFIVDDSGSMNPFKEQANTLAQAIFEAGWTGRHSLVVTTTFNGHYTTTSNEDQGYWVNGDFKGPLPESEEYGVPFNSLDFARRWQWWLEEFLPKEHNIRPRIVVFFSDDHGAYQWNYLSNNINGMTIVWLDPNHLQDTSYRDKTGVSVKGPYQPIKEWSNSIFVKGYSPDSGFTADQKHVSSMGWPNMPIEFRRFDGRFFSSISSISDIIEAIKRIANI
jgi:hypothetical protein